MDYLSLKEAQDDLANLIQKTSESHQPIVINAPNNSNAVLLALEDWNAIQETLYLLSIPGMRESIIEGGNTPVDECISAKNIEW